VSDPIDICAFAANFGQAYPARNTINSSRQWSN